MMLSATARARGFNCTAFLEDFYRQAVSCPAEVIAGLENGRPLRSRRKSRFDPAEVKFSAELPTAGTSSDLQEDIVG